VCVCVCVCVCVLEQQKQSVLSSPTSTIQLDVLVVPTTLGSWPARKGRARGCTHRAGGHPGSEISKMLRALFLFQCLAFTTPSSWPSTVDISVCRQPATNASHLRDHQCSRNVDALPCRADGGSWSAHPRDVHVFSPRARQGLP
jgi:hypothetical protein